MTEENKTYIRQLKVADVPWHRLTTAYGRGTDFPAHLTLLEQMRDLASVKKVPLRVHHQPGAPGHPVARHPPSARCS